MVAVLMKLQSIHVQTISNLAY